ncbi:FAD-binding protein [Candidatus Bathyarchaeota archaeon]|nr:FAD-binding protein [Candidatus Bathyarchaeota archaeon]
MVGHAYTKPDENDLEFFESVVGRDNASANEAIMQSYLSKSVMGLESDVPDIVVKPKYVEEVRKILVHCSARKIAVSPISAGLSGGFACPLIKPAGVLLDMQRMNRILEVDEDNRYVVIEPGVTAGEIWAYFSKYHPDWAPPIADGAPPAATIMGDAIERGFSLVTSSFGPQGEMVQGLEVVVPRGDIIRTGTWGLNGAKPFYRWGLGPEIFSCFMGSQGTMGVVTKAAIKIVPHPHAKTIIAWAMDNPEDMQDLTLEVSKKEFGISHNCVMVQGGNWPLVQTRWPKEKVPAEYEWFKKAGIPEWWMNFEIWAQSDKELEHVVDTIDGIAKDFKANRAQSSESIKRWELHPAQVKARLRKPNKIAIPYSLYEAGFLFITWYTPWKDCAEFARIYNKILEKYDFAPVMWIASIERARQAICMPIVCFDSSKPEDFERVQEVNRETTEIMLPKGWVNYRPDPYIHAPKTYSMAGTYYKYLKLVKEMFDPDYIMHPGRLCLP